MSKRITKLKEIVGYFNTKRSYEKALVDPNFDINSILRLMRHYKKAKTKVQAKASPEYRAYTAKTIKALRRAYPTKIEDFSEAKALYLKQQAEGERVWNDDDLKIGDWIVGLGADYAEKGNWGRYYINFRYNEEGKGYKIDSMHPECGVDCSVRINDMLIGLGNDELNWGQFRKATPKEAVKFEAERATKIYNHYKDKYDKAKKEFLNALDMVKAAQQMADELNKQVNK